jgi:hypothetical protein
VPDTIRDAIGDFIGQRLVEITAHDLDTFTPGDPGEVFLHFGDGRTLHFWVTDAGFDVLDSTEDPDA